MDPKQLQEIITQVLKEGITIKWWVYLIVGSIALIGSFLGAYLKKKGENYATKEDFENLLDQVRKTTEATEKIKNEFYLTKATYDKYIEIIMDYYSNIYKYYRSCQEAARCTYILSLNGTLKTTEERYLKKLDEIVEEHKAHEGYIRLLLPAKIQDINSKLVVAFNKFRRIIKEGPGGEEKQRKLQECFNTEIDKCKQDLELALRKFLKIEQFIKPEP